MFDGNHGSERFDEKDIKDITKYSLKQITALINEFNDSDYEIDDNEGEFGPDLKLTEVNIDASKNMWESEETVDDEKTIQPNERTQNSGWDMERIMLESQDEINRENLGFEDDREQLIRGGIGINNIFG